MAIIVQSLAYSDGNTLSTADHAANIYSESAALGIVSEPNGGLDENNTVAGFEVRAEHVWPGEAVRMDMDGLRRDQDYMDTAIGSDPDDLEYVAIPGLSKRFRLSYQSTTLLQWSVFASAWVYVVNTSDTVGRNRGGTPDDEGPYFALQAFLNGTAIPHTLRRFPPTVYRDSAVFSGASNGYNLRSTEMWNGRWFDMAHIQLNQAETATGGGWNELSIRLGMESMTNRSGVNYTANDDVIPRHIQNVDGTTVIDSTTKVHGRVTLGLRNVRCASFLAL